MEAFSYWGLCPECKSEPEVLNIGRDHWMICSAHKFKWCVGANLFSAWRHEDECIWSENREKLADFVEVKPYHPDAEAGHPDPEKRAFDVWMNEEVPKRAAEISERFTIEYSDGLRICERPSNWGGEFVPCRYWSPPMQSLRAAELAMPRITSDLAMGLDPEAECRKDGHFEHCNRLASLLTYLEQQGVPDADSLAKKLAADQPWQGFPSAFDGADDLPF